MMTPFIPRYDFHLHTALCGHASKESTLANLAARADVVGLDTICITEHVGSTADYARIEQLQREAARIRSRCRVVVGMEVDADRKQWDGLLAYDVPDDIPYVLASIHFVPGTNVLPHCQSMPELTDEQVFDRWRSTFLGMVQNPRIDCIAHPGVMICSSRRNQGITEDVLDVFRAAAVPCLRNGIAWEVNDAVDAKLSAPEQEAYHRILQVGVDAGVRLVYGSDAHSPDRVGSTGWAARVVANLRGVNPDDFRIPPCDRS